MPVTTITDSTRSRQINFTSGVYATANAGAVGDATGTSLYVAQFAGFTIYRTALEFDTSILPAGAIVTDARFRLFAVFTSAGTFNVVIQNGMPTFPSDPVVVGDYDRTQYSGNGGSAPASNWFIGSYYELPLNKTGYGWITPTGVSKFLLRSSDDIAVSPPGGNDYAVLGDLTNPLKYPILDLNYVMPGPGTQDFYDLSRGGGLICGPTFVYFNVHNPVNSNPGVNPDLLIGQDCTGGVYTIFRSYIMVDTSCIPVGATITSAKLNMNYTAKDTSGRDFLITVQNGQPTYPHEPLVVGDWDFTKYSDDGGTLDTATLIAPNTRYNLPLNATGISWINKGGITKLCLRSEYDISNTAPPSHEYCRMGSRSTAGQEPYLEVTWTGPPPRSGAGVVRYGLFH